MILLTMAKHYIEALDESDDFELEERENPMYTCPSDASCPT